MPASESPEKLLSKHLGQEGASALLGKIDKMVAEGATAAKIEKMANDDIATHIERGVVVALVAKLGPMEPIKVKPLQVSVGTNVKVQVGPVIKINIPVQVKIGPPTFTKGGPV